MPVSDRFSRPRGRLAAATASGALLAVAALGVPSSATAYENHFCQYETMTSTEVCKAPYRHTLQNVQGWTIGSSDRICAASYTMPYGGIQNSDWRCEYSWVQKLLYGNVEGVGAIRNGDPQTFVGYGVQEF